MFADCVLAQVKKELSKDIYDYPNKIIEDINKIENMKAEIIDFRNDFRPSFKDWDCFLDKYLGDMPLNC